MRLLAPIRGLKRMEARLFVERRTVPGQWNLSVLTECYRTIRNPPVVCLVNESRALEHNVLGRPLN